MPRLFSCAEHTILAPRMDAQQPRKLGRVGLIIWLAGPFVVIALLYLMVDRSRGKPDPSLLHKPAPAGHAGH